MYGQTHIGEEEEEEGEKKGGREIDSPCLRIDLRELQLMRGHHLG